MSAPPADDELQGMDAEEALMQFLYQAPVGLCDLPPTVPAR